MIVLGKVLVCDTRICDRLNQGQHTVHHVQKEAYHEALRLWEAERDLVKFENWQSGWKKPMRGELEKVEKKPKKSGVSSNSHCKKEGYNGTSDDSASDGGSEEE